MSDEAPASDTDKQPESELLGLRVVDEAEPCAFFIASDGGLWQMHDKDGLVLRIHAPGDERQLRVTNGPFC